MSDSGTIPQSQSACLPVHQTLYLSHYMGTNWHPRNTTTSRKAQRHLSAALPTALSEKHIISHEPHVRKGPQELHYLWLKSHLHHCTSWTSCIICDFQSRLEDQPSLHLHTSSVGWLGSLKPISREHHPLPNWLPFKSYSLRKEE